MSVRKIFLLVSFACYLGLSVAAPENRGDGKALIGIGHYLIQRQGENSAPRWAYKISFVLPDSAAFHGGLQVGDVLLSWDGRTLDSVSTTNRSSALRDYLKAQKRVGEDLAISFFRYSVQLGNSSPTQASALKNEWLAYLQHPQKNLKKEVEITYYSNKMNKIITLGKRRDDVELPSQTKLLSEIEPAADKTINLASPLYGLPQKLISTFNLSADYEDLLVRYEEDEKWQQRFINQRFQYVHRAPFDLLPIAEHQTDKIIQQSNQGHLSLLNLLAQQLTFSDHAKDVFEPLDVPLSDKLQDHIDFINAVLTQAHQARSKAFVKLTPKEVTKLTQELPQMMTRFADSYYIHQDKDGDTMAANKQNRELLALLDSVDLQAFLTASYTLLQLTDKQWIKTLGLHSSKWLQEQEEQSKQSSASTVLGRVIASYQSTYGKVIIGSNDNNIYTQAAMMIIDLGGNDKYYGAHSPQLRPMNVIIDREGDDLYSSTVPYAQAATLLGVSLLFDYAGNDRYLASYYAQGVAIGGVAMLYDEAGDDRYSGQRFAQGAGFWGIGLLYDKAGDDHYSAWRYAQGVGGVGGLGVLLDKRGKDRYHAVGESRSSYGTVGNFQSSSQGFGVGFRGYAPGGTGLLLDGQGEDYYEAGNFAQGVGYFFALGILRDFGDENDVYHASRYGIGASAHSAAGVFIEDGGNDRYAGNHIALIGSAWDLALAAFWDKKGNDTYRQTARGFSIGVAAHNGHSVFLDSSGQDNYHILKQQQQAPNNNYHGGHSFAFFIDAGGERDNYHQEKFNNNTFLYEYDHAFMLDLPISLDARSKNIFWQSLQ